MSLVLKETLLGSSGPLLVAFTPLPSLREGLPQSASLTASLPHAHSAGPAVPRPGVIGCRFFF